MRQKESDADPKAIQQIEFVEQLKKTEGTQNMFILMLLEKIKKARLKFSQEM